MVRVCERARRSTLACMCVHWQRVGACICVTLLCVLGLSLSGFLFGGYASCAWESGPAHFLPCHRAFLFSVTSPAGFMSQYPLLPGRASHAVWSGEGLGPCFGAPDLMIASVSRSDGVFDGGSGSPCFGSTYQVGCTCSAFPLVYARRDAEVYCNASCVCLCAFAGCALQGENRVGGIRNIPPRGDRSVHCAVKTGVGVFHFRFRWIRSAMIFLRRGCSSGLRLWVSMNSCTGRRHVSATQARGQRKHVNSEHISHNNTN